MRKLEIVEGFREETNEVILALCIVERNTIVETLAVLTSAGENS